MSLFFSVDIVQILYMSHYFPWFLSLLATHIQSTSTIVPRRVNNRFDLTCKAPDVLYEEVIEIDERVMLAEFYDENKSNEEIGVLEHMSQTIQGGGQYYSSDWPKAGIGKRITGVTGEIVSCLFWVLRECVHANRTVAISNFIDPTNIFRLFRSASRIPMPYAHPSRHWPTRVLNPSPLCSFIHTCTPSMKSSWVK